MFLKHRSLQAEYFDSLDRPAKEVAEGYAMLNHFNRIFLLTEPFKRMLPKLFGPERCRSLSILDLGAGDGFLGNELSHWAVQRGWKWQFTNLDLNHKAMLSNPTGRSITGSAVELPFCNDAFDVVIASQMAHHLPTEDDVPRHFQEAWRVTGDVLFLNDLHRNIALYGVLWLLLRLHRLPEHFRTDGLLSVLRGWRVSEWRRLAAEARIPGARVWLYAGARVMLLARKQR